MTKDIYIPSNIGMGLLGIAYPLGSDYEVPGKKGTHHLMEHLMCKSFDSLLPKLKRLGIDYNAFTSTNRIVFYFSGLSECLDGMAKELYDLITSGTYTWSEEDFDNEKKTVLQEYEDVFNEQVGGTLVNIFIKHYNYSDPIGLRSDIENFSYQDSLYFRKRFQNPMLLCQVGNKNISITESIDKIFLNPIPKFGNYNVSLEKIPKKKKFLGIFGEDGKTVVGLLSKHLIQENELNKVGMVIDCLNDGLESPLLQEIRDKNGLSYFSLGNVFSMYNTGAIVFLSCTSNCNTDKLKKVYSEFFSGDLSRHISQERFADCYNGMMVQKKICDRLPHKGAMKTILSPSPFDGLEDFTYEEAIDLLNKHFDISKYQEIKY